MKVAGELISDVAMTLSKISLALLVDIISA